MKFLLLAFLLFSPVRSADNCVSGYATLHRSWASVFYYFPERQDPSVDGYIAVTDCSLMNEYRWLHFGDHWYWVRIADCLNRSLTPKEGWLVDVSPNIWYAEFPYAPLGGHPAKLCRALPPFQPGLQSEAKLLRIIK